MFLNRVTGSSYGLARNCVHPFVTDQSLLKWDNKPGYSARTGSAFHKAAEDYLKTGNVNWGDISIRYSLTPKQLERCQRMFQAWEQWLETQDTTGWKVEQKYWFDPVAETAGAFTSEGERDYSLAQGPFAMTMDVVDVQDGHPQALVIDWKTGFWVEHPQDSQQMAMAAMCVMYAHPQVEDVKLVIAKITPDSVYELDHTFTREAVTDGLIHQALDVMHMASSPDRRGPNPGGWCARCPVRKVCSESTKRD